MHVFGARRFVGREMGRLDKTAELERRVRVFEGFYAIFEKDVGVNLND